MLVQFTRKDGTHLVGEDSSQLRVITWEDFNDKEKYAEYHVEFNDPLKTCWEISKETHDYILNAKAHEGMRRVRTPKGCGWTDSSYYYDKSDLCKIVEFDDGEVIAFDHREIRFIPYEMEEQK